MMVTRMNLGRRAMKPGDLDSWVDRYVTAWRSNDSEDIGSLFTEDARYYTAPFREPWVGRDVIVAGWIDRKDEPGQWEFRHEILGADGDVGFVRGWTRYAPTDQEPQTDYSNLWIIRLEPDGRCSEFTEWWMEHS
jgi:ketosteroid isomerase-like protein